MARVAPDFTVERWRILLVDDHDETREGYAAYLRYLGAEVFTAADGVEAVDAAFRFLPDVIVTDLSMPQMDGWQAVRLLRRDPRTRRIPVIAITAHLVDSTDATTMHAAGFDMFCVKPCRPSDLVRAIQSVLNARRALALPGPGRGHGAAPASERRFKSR